MKNASTTLIDLEKKFWQSMVDEDPGTAIDLLAEPSLMVSPQGAFKFDHAKYRQMAANGSMVLKDYELGDVDVVQPSDDTAILTYRVRQTVQMRDKPATTQEMFDTSTWIRVGSRWQCVAHTETPASKS